jgi:peroxiredoxin
VSEAVSLALEGQPLPDVRLPSTHGEIDLRAVANGVVVVFVYPRTGVPDLKEVPGWNEIPGAVGCSAETCAFRDREHHISELGAQVMGLSAQPADEQREFALRERISYPLLNDSAFVVAGKLGLPTFSAAGSRFYSRLTLVATAGHISKVFYPIASPAQHPAEVVRFLSDPT